MLAFTSLPWLGEFGSVIPGCRDGLARLLDPVRFDPASDRLALAGDLLDRGGKSLKVLRFVSALGAPHLGVLGNHDLHLLLAEGQMPDSNSDRR